MNTLMFGRVVKVAKVSARASDARSMNKVAWLPTPVRLSVWMLFDQSRKM